MLADLKPDEWNFGWNQVPLVFTLAPTRFSAICHPKTHFSPLFHLPLLRFSLSSLHELVTFLPPTKSLSFAP